MNGCKHLLLCILVVSLVPLAAPLDAANVVFVGDVDGDDAGDGSNPLYAAADASMINHITNVLGHTVTTIDDTMATATAVAGADFVVVSATASSNAYGTNDSGDGNSGATNSLGTDATILLMESGTGVVVPFGLAGGSFGTHIGTDIQILELDGYLTNGFEVGTISIYDNPEIGGEEIRGFAARPPNGANVGFPQLDWTGDNLIGIAPVAFEPVVLGTHRIGDNLIVALPFGNAGFDHLTAHGLQLFNNAFSPPSVIVDGDYNGDGTVNAADYTVWRDGGSPDDSQAGYELWKANFGAAGSGQGPTSVPEPAAAIYAIVGAALVGGWLWIRKAVPPAVVSN
jgi:hypothetical protein